MVDTLDRFEISDMQGTTLQYSGTVGTTPEVFPDPAGPLISEFLIQCPEDQSIDNRLLISMNGTDFITIQPTGHLAWTPKGDSVTQITIKGNQAGVEYEMIINQEESA